mmetsp:Transcript_20249/g.61678  ORF Transcript_20249/g.61678 Transcript_20249/m.61678 type:complete len:291 (+) Transcript_20249:939-1811(+)
MQRTPCRKRIPDGRGWLAVRWTVGNGVVHTGLARRNPTVPRIITKALQTVRWGRALPLASSPGCATAGASPNQLQGSPRCRRERRRWCSPCSRRTPRSDSLLSGHCSMRGCPLSTTTIARALHEFAKGCAACPHQLSRQPRAARLISRRYATPGSCAEVRMVQRSRKLLHRKVLLASALVVQCSAGSQRARHKAIGIRATRMRTRTTTRLFVQCVPTLTGLGRCTVHRVASSPCPMRKTRSLKSAAKMIRPPRGWVSGDPCQPRETSGESDPRRYSGAGDEPPTMRACSN